MAFNTKKEVVFIKKKSTITIICLLVVLIGAFYFLNGGIIAIGTWCQTPFECLTAFTDDESVTYKEIKTVYLGKNGSDGAVLFYIEDDTYNETVMFTVGRFDSKKKKDGYVYTHHSSASYLIEDIDSKIITVDDISYNIEKGYSLYLSQLDKNTAANKTQALKDKNPSTLSFEYKGKTYSVDYYIFKE